MEIRKRIIESRKPEEFYTLLDRKATEMGGSLPDFARTYHIPCITEIKNKMVMPTVDTMSTICEGLDISADMFWNKSEVDYSKFFKAKDNTSTEVHKRTRLAMELDPEVKAKLTRIAKSKNMSVADLVRSLIADMLSNYKEEPKKELELMGR